jgi:D-glycero-alpha-D-manno-heptose 1-phosphate guanylyltransferase
MSAPASKRALVLAGGFGTRLAAAVPGLPKLLAPIGERPFVDILLELLAGKGIDDVVLLLGVRAGQIEAHLAAAKSAAKVRVSVEPEPRGTAGAVAFARRFCDQTFWLLNGDTYLDFDPAALTAAHRAAGAALTLAATRVQDAGRYGTLDVDAAGRLHGFREKDPERIGPALINGGVYLVEPRVVAGIPDGVSRSLETDVLPALVAGGETVIAVEQPGAFFDIGTEASWRAFGAFFSAVEGRAS